MDHTAQVELRDGLLAYLRKADDSYRDATLAVQPARMAPRLGTWDARAARLNETIIDTNEFEIAMATVIMVGAVMTGMQLEYHEYYDSHPLAVINVVDAVVIYIFCVECLLRIAAEGSKPWKYFLGNAWFPEHRRSTGGHHKREWDARARWNNFDFTVSWVSFAFLWVDAGAASGALSTVRLLRIVRLMSLMTRFEELMVILSGFEEAMRSFMYIALLLVMVIYAYSIIGLMLFAANDPAHFGNLSVSFLTLVRSATLARWYTVLYINWYGCEQYPGGHYRMPDSFFGHLDSGAYDDDGGSKITYRKTLFGSFPEYICRDPQGQPFAAFLYFFTFTILSAFVILSLLVGTVTISMSNTMRTLHDHQTRQRRNNAVKWRFQQHPIIYTRYVFGGRSGKTIMYDVDGLPRVQLLEPVIAKAELSERELRQLKRVKQKMMARGRSHLDNAGRMQDDGADDEEFVFGVETPRRATLAHMCRTAIRGRVEVKSIHMPEARAAMKKRAMAQAGEIIRRGIALESSGGDAAGGAGNETSPRGGGGGGGASSGGDSSSGGGSRKRPVTLVGVLKRLWLGSFATWARKFVKGRTFSTLLVSFILLYGALVGVLTTDRSDSPAVVFLSSLCIFFFLSEVVLKVAAEGPDPMNYFKDNYNVFDFLLAVGGLAALLAQGGEQNPIISLLRMVRLLQLFKLAHNLPRLQLVTEALVYGMKSMMWVAMLLVMFNYLFGLLGLILFRENDPFHFGRLGRSFTTLWRVETLNDWETPMYVNIYGCSAYGYYGSAALHFNASTAGEHSWSSSAVSPVEQREWARELPRVDLARMGHFHAYQFPCEKKDHEDGDGAARPLGWFAAAYFLLVVVVGGIILPTLLTAVIAASTVHMGLQTAERQANQAKLGGVIAVAPSYLHPARVEILQELFDNLDMNGNGTLDAEELRPAFTALSDEMLKHMTPALLKKLFDLVDKDHGGAVDFSEFLLFFSRITSAMALRLGRAATEFVEDPVTFEKEFVRLMLEMAYGIALDDDDDDENGQTPAVADWLRARNATPLTINNNKNNDGDKSRAELDDLGEEGLVVKSPLVVHAAAEAERGAVAIGQVLLNDVDALVGKTSIAGISHTPSTIFDVFDVKQLHRHIRWLASRLEATSSEAAAAKRELRSLKEVLGAFDRAAAPEAAKPSPLPLSSEAESRRALSVRALQDEICGMAHRGYREQWESKVAAKQFAAANEATAAASAHAMEAAAAATAVAAEMEAEAELKASAAAAAERNRRASEGGGTGRSGRGGRRQRGSSNASGEVGEFGPAGGYEEEKGSFGIFGSGDGGDGGDGDNAGRKRGGSSKRSGKHSRSASADRKVRIASPAEQPSQEPAGPPPPPPPPAPVPLATDLALEDCYVGGERLRHSVAALQGEWRALIDMADVLVRHAAEGSLAKLQDATNPHLPVAQWSSAGGWGRLVAHGHISGPAAGSSSGAGWGLASEGGVRRTPLPPAI